MSSECPGRPLEHGVELWSGVLMVSISTIYQCQSTFGLNLLLSVSQAQPAPLHVGPEAAGARPAKTVRPVSPVGSMSVCLLSLFPVSLPV